MDFSVIVLTYNSDYCKVEKTLHSIIKQQNIHYEIIVCDDASAENHFEQIEFYLASNHISHYKLLGSEKNQGTVSNILNGLAAASGKYTKLIGAGDLLYNSLTLHDVYAFMENGNISACFGLMQGYKKKDGKYFSVPHYSPRDINAYRKSDTRKILRNLLLTEDWVSGAGIFATTSYYQQYISMLKGKVLYCEDWASALSAVDGVYLALLDQYVIWYEVGDGISTASTTLFQQKLHQDNLNFWKLFDEYSQKNPLKEIQKYRKKRERKKKFDNINNLFLQTFCKAIANPDMVFQEFHMQKQEKSNSHSPRIIKKPDFIQL